MSHRLLVLAWHNVLPTWAFPGPPAEVAVAAFTRQVRFLRRWTNVLPLERALADLGAGRPLPPRAVALTFDDGYLDNVRVAAPVLQANDLPATFFLVTDFLSGTGSAWWEDLAWGITQTREAATQWDGQGFDLDTPVGKDLAMWRLSDGLKVLDAERRRARVEELVASLAPEGTRPRTPTLFMDWQAATALLRMGHHVGSHTCSHAVLSRETEAVQRHELVVSRRLLQDRLQVEADVLAMPNGRRQDYDATTLSLAADAGYSFACTTVSGRASSRDRRHEVKRVVVDAQTDVRWVLREAARAARRAVRHPPSPRRGGAATEP